MRPQLHVSGSRRFGNHNFEICKCCGCGKPVEIDDSLVRQCYVMADSLEEMVKNFNELGPFECEECATSNPIVFSARFDYKAGSV